MVLDQGLQTLQWGFMKIFEGSSETQIAYIFPASDIFKKEKENCSIIFKMLWHIQHIQI